MAITFRSIDTETLNEGEESNCATRIGAHDGGGGRRERWRTAIGIDSMVSLCITLSFIGKIAQVSTRVPSRMPLA